MADITHAHIGTRQADNRFSLDNDYAAECSVDVADGGDIFLHIAIGVSELANRSSSFELELLDSGGVDFSIAEAGQVQAACACDVVTQFSFVRNPIAFLQPGSELALAESFTSHTATSTVSGVQTWRATADSSTCPNPIQRPIASTTPFVATRGRRGPVSPHAGPTSPYSVNRFDTPRTDTYDKTSSLTGSDGAQFP